MVETDNSLDNYPLPFEVSKLFQGATAVWSSLELKNPKPEDIAVSLASAGTHLTVIMQGLAKVINKPKKIHVEVKVFFFSFGKALTSKLHLKVLQLQLLKLQSITIAKYFN